LSAKAKRSFLEAGYDSDTFRLLQQILRNAGIGSFHQFIYYFGRFPESIGNFVVDQQHRHH
jgi:hypothetical protein